MMIRARVIDASTASAPNTTRLRDGNIMPRVGMGTFQMPAAVAERLAAAGLRLGYGAIDTASFYGNEAEVGRAIRARATPTFITTKLWRTDMGFERARAAFDRSFTALALRQIDLYLIHWPEPQTDLYVASWKALIALKQEGRVRSIGVSNFAPAHLRRIIDETGEVPVVNQVECHPYFQQRALKIFCREHGIKITAWSPLGRGFALSDPAIVRVAAKHGRTPAQIVLRWHLQQDTIVIPKASSPDRLRENLQLFDFALDADDLARIDRLDLPNGRIGPDPDDTPNFKGLPPSPGMR